ncbi:MAG: hypothetical protein JHC84_05835 [Solirubrobacteraceae bacterium]|nr:hypothetical protein [Solirubrobacteraceae bacterium]
MKVIVLLALVAFVFPASASAELRPDSAAPPGTTDPLWLPEEEWVMERWMPFDETRLVRALGLSRSEVYVYLKSGQGSLRDLARRQRVELTTTYLLANRKPLVSTRTYNVLRSRAQRMLTQRHLAEHVIGHIWHRWSILHDRPGIFGPQYAELARAGVGFESMFLQVDVPRRELQERVLTRLRVATQRGVAAGALSAQQAVIQQRQEAEFVQILCPLA